MRSAELDIVLVSREVITLGGHLLHRCFGLVDRREFDIQPTMVNAHAAR